MGRYLTIVAATGMVLAGVSGALAMNVETVPVGNPGNAGEWAGESYGGYGPDRICGAVDYTYNIGKYEVTAGQYTEFLNAVAATDTHGLYNPNMDTALNSYGCNIKQTGSSGSYQYSVASEWANRPVNFVTFWDACRFSNWLQNGQLIGAQDLTTTEDGAYFLNGVTYPTNTSITRKADATWVIPTEDEWYKAAYYDPDTIFGGPGYYDYPTHSNFPYVPVSDDLVDPDPGHNATCKNDDYTIDSPYWRTEVGAHENSDSPYGTFDQGGNVWEWNETLFYVFGGYRRGTRGGSFDLSSSYLHASSDNFYSPDIVAANHGFRVAYVPEPATLCFLALGGLAAVRRRR
ncbi:MAG TPA: SUMF1/EgtB/PvdO family nonheme iron enzyme [Phycisphaerae bacterium]|nr:SUMF1/EgtB/PvdO family nonheme iron enzyme [Phycisphaerae bacterium]